MIMIDLDNFKRLGRSINSNILMGAIENYMYNMYNNIKFKLYPLYVQETD